MSGAEKSGKPSTTSDSSGNHKPAPTRMQSQPKPQEPGSHAGFDGSAAGGANAAADGASAGASGSASANGSVNASR